MIKVSNFDSMCAENGLFIKGNILSFSIIQNRSVKLLLLLENKDYSIFTPLYS